MLQIVNHSVDSVFDAPSVGSFGDSEEVADRQVAELERLDDEESRRLRAELVGTRASPKKEGLSTPRGRVASQLENASSGRQGH